jgi:hypothetical protein
MTDAQVKRSPKGAHPFDPGAAAGNRLAKRLKIASACAATLALVTVAAAFWLGMKVTTVRTELESARRLTTQLKTEVAAADSASSAKTVAELVSHTTNAREAVNDPVWLLAGALPFVGASFQATREVATSADDVARLAGQPLVSILETMNWKSLMPDGHGVALAPLAAAQSKLASAALAVGQSSDRLNGIDANVLLPQISAPLVESREQLASLRRGLESAADAARLLPAMMGEQTPRRYLLLVQNNAESRSTGGIPGAMAVLTFDAGKLSMSEQTSASAVGVFKPAVAVEREQSAIYSTRLGKFMQDVNLTPDFPTVAQTAQAMWKTRTGEQLDGVLSVDPIALSYMLDATGPVSLNDPLLRDVAGDRLPTELTAKNVVPTLLSDVYLKIDDPSIQDAYFAGVAQAVFTKLSSGAGDTKKLMDGITTAASQRRILLSSSRPDEEAVISKYPVGGAVTGAGISPAQFGVYFNDGTGAKMDYFVKRTVQLVTYCPVDGYSEVRVRVSSRNTAPKNAATSLPPYVTGAGAFGVPAGSVQTNVTAYGPVQSNIETAVVGGKKSGFASYRHSDRPVASVTIRLAPGQAQTVEFTFGKIVQNATPRLSVTPTVQAEKEVILGTQAASCPKVP